MRGASATSDQRNLSLGEDEPFIDRRLLLGGIVLIAVAVRLAGLGDGLSDAEGYSWLVGSAPNVDVFFDRLAAYENTPPLFYALLAPLPLDDEVWLRLPALIPGVLTVPVLYCVVRPLLGTQIALLSALGLAVAPFHVSYSNYSRGFMLAGLGVLLATWAVARLAEGRRARWWWLYVAGGALALHSEYYTALVLVPLLGLLLLIRARPWKEIVGFGVLPALTLLPLVGEMRDGLDQLNETKISPIFPEPSPASLRDTTVSLLFGEHGTASGAPGRTLQFVVLAGAIAIAIVWLGRGAFRLDRLSSNTRRLAVLLFAAVPGVALLLHAIVAFPGPDIFEARYLSGLIPFIAVLLASAVVAVPWRYAAPLACLALLGLSLVVFVKREGRELEPDVAAAAPVLERAGARTVLTNSAVVVYYLRDWSPRLNRPFGLGTGDAETCRRACPRPVVVVDDSRVGAGARTAPGPRFAIGPIQMQLLPAP